MEVERVIAEAKKAKTPGATRYCMGAAWRSPKARDMDAVVAMVEGVKALGMETCMTLGMLSDGDVGELSDAGLDYYNHNIDTSERYYDKIITTRTFADRLDTLARVREAGIKVCCGRHRRHGRRAASDRVDMLVTLANLDAASRKRADQHAGRRSRARRSQMPSRIDADRFRAHDRAGPHHDAEVATSASRPAAPQMSDETQALCFFAGANSIFVGDTLLTADNPGGRGRPQAVQAAGAAGDLIGLRITYLG